MRNLNEPLVKCTMNGNRIEVDSPHDKHHQSFNDYYDKRQKSQSGSLKIIVYSVLILACLVIGLQLWTLI